MMKNYILVLLMLLSFVYVEADTIFVKEIAVGAEDGSTWNDAMADLNSAITSASSGDQIWVAKGTYTPGATRSSSFVLKGHVKIYGGFSGSESNVDSRTDYGDGGMNQTLLSGDIGVLSDVSDNVYTVVKMEDGSGALSENLLDGFIIADGNGDNTTDGVGLYCTNGAKLLLKNCVIKDCINGDEAGALYLINGAVVVFDEGEIRDCSALLTGGAGTILFGAQLDFVNGLVAGNSVVSNGAAGGAFYATQGGVVNLIDSRLYDNTASDGAGGALYAQYVDLYVSNCHFANNYAKDGGAMFFIGGAPDVNNCLIANNEASNNGGGMYLGQWTRTSGAHLYVYTSDPIFANNTIVNNKSQIGNGGGVYTQKSSALYFINNIFSGNDPYEISIFNHGLNLGYSYVKGGESGIDFDVYTITYPGGSYGSTNADGLLTFKDSTTSVGLDPSSPSFTDADWTVLSGSANIDVGSPTVASCGEATYPSLCVDNDSNRVRYNVDHMSLLSSVCVDGKDRVNGTIDIGALEFYDIPTGVQQVEAGVTSMFVYDRTLYLGSAGVHSLVVFNLQGQMVYQKEVDGVSQVTLGLENGFYLVKANTDVGIETAKVYIR